MRITRINNNITYSSNTFLIRGDFNDLQDKNVLIDTGGDASIVKKILNINTGAGKKPVDKIILTHNHFDHTGGIKALKETFSPAVYAFTDGPNVDHILKDNQIIKAGDKQLQVIHTPGHSHDSICLFGWEDKILFSGDTPINIISKDGSYSKEFINSITKLSGFDINTIYPGHGEPVNNGNKIILESLHNIISKKVFNKKNTNYAIEVENN